MKIDFLTVQALKDSQRLWDLCVNFIVDNNIYDREQTCSYFNKQLTEKYEQFIMNMADIVGYIEKIEHDEDPL